MTLRDWLQARSPRPPDQLAERIADVLGHAAPSDADPASACLNAAEALLTDLLSRRSAGRESALDLLAVDALTTYAFEAASASPETIPERAGEAMRRFGALARQ